MNLTLSQTQVEELISVLDIFVMEDISEDNSFVQVYETIVSQTQETNK